VLAKRIICCLDVADGRVVKGVKFQDLRDAGDPVELAQRYNDEGIDELVFLDISATLDDRRTLVDLVVRAAAVLSIPFTVGGGIRSAEDAKRLMDAGADKVSVNSAAIVNHDLLSEIALQYGDQAVVLAIDAKRNGSSWEVWTRAGTINTGLDAVAWAQKGEACGAGEILLTSIDADGGQRGFDCALTRAVSEGTRVPVVASGGAGEAEDFVEVLTSGCADAALGASVFHYGQLSVADIKRTLARAGVPVRPAR